MLVDRGFCVFSEPVFLAMYRKCKGEMNADLPSQLKICNLRVQLTVNPRQCAIKMSMLGFMHVCS